MPLAVMGWKGWNGVLEGGHRCSVIIHDAANAPWWPSIPDIPRGGGGGGAIKPLQPLTLRGCIVEGGDPPGGVVDLARDPTAGPPAEHWPGSAGEGA